LTSTTEEDFRHRCEVSYVLAIRATNRNQAMQYLSLVRIKRKGNADKLINDCKTQWDKGNRGEKGDWRV